MGERSPFIIDYGVLEGRLAPSAFTPTDGRFAYVLGSELQNVHRLRSGDDYVEIYQDLDLTDVDVVAVDSKLLQPDMIPSRNVAGHDPGTGWVYTASLLRGEVLEHYDMRLSTASNPVYAKQFHPGTETKLAEPYLVIASSRLRVCVDGGADQDIVFPASPPVLTLTASEIVEIINSQVTGAHAQLGIDADDPTVILTSNSSGLAASIEVKAYPGPEDDANRTVLPNGDIRGIDFFMKTGTPSAIYGGDDLSAISAPNAEFTDAYTELPLRVSGASIPGNNLTNHIMMVASPTLALLQLPVASEGPGFDANVLGSKWQVTIRINGAAEFTRIVGNDRAERTNDLAVNVSKLTGIHQVGFRLQLVIV
jgi:hypothetical protein